jgi:hypothetical protein
MLSDPLAVISTVAPSATDARLVHVTTSAAHELCITANMVVRTPNASCKTKLQIHP